MGNKSLLQESMERVLKAQKKRKKDKCCDQLNNPPSKEKFHAELENVKILYQELLTHGSAKVLEKHSRDELSCHLHCIMKINEYLYEKGEVDQSDKRDTNCMLLKFIFCLSRTKKKKGSMSEISDAEMLSALMKNIHTM